MAEQSSEEAAPVQLVLVRVGGVGLRLACAAQRSSRPVFRGPLRGCSPHVGLGAASLECVDREGFGGAERACGLRCGGDDAVGAPGQDFAVYRWWASPAEILLEALNEGAAHIAPLEEEGDLEQDLRTFLRRSVLGAREPVGRLLASLMAEAQRDPTFAESFRAGFLAKRRGVLRELLEHAVERGELEPGIDLDFLVELFFAGLWYRLLAATGPLDRRFADNLTDALLTLAHAAAKRPRSAS